MQRVDFTNVTEIHGGGASREQMSMLYTRYKCAIAFCTGKDVLEVACGTGMGLGYLAKSARSVVGGDCEENLLLQAQRHYKKQLPLIRLDAHALPFTDSSFDVVLLHEAIYYLTDPKRFVTECRRVLRKGGVLIVATVNKEWLDFNPSPFSTQYFSANELAELLRDHRFNVEVYGAFPVARDSVTDVIVSFIKRTAIALHIMPRTMKGKEFFKRVFFGKLLRLPPEVQDGMAQYCSLQSLTQGGAKSSYKVVFAIGYMGND
jgi:ubiquinone/menaquinone biosynthesis C-methylase UbiE